MRVLFVGPKDTPDYLGSGIWDGLQEVLGESNVVDAVGSPWLHRSTAKALCKETTGVGYLGGKEIVLALSGSREGERWHEGKHTKHYFDLMVVNASFDRDLDWGWLGAHCDWSLKPGNKVAYIEGWDAAWDIHPPQIHVDAVFRKEISPAVSYPYGLHHLAFAAPARWIPEDVLERERPIDIFFSGNANSCLPGQEVRWPMMQRVFQTARRHRSIISSCGLGLEHYFTLLRASKLALCPSGADLTDSLRTMEAVAAGAVPVFVGYPDFIRDPWFTGEMSFSCTVDTLAAHIDEALSQDLSVKRRALMEHVRKYHTTAARARQMLAILGMEP